MGDIIEHWHRHTEAGPAPQGGEVYAHHRDIPVPALDQGLSQKVDVVGGPASPAGLGDEKGDFMGIVFSAVEGIHHLPDDQQGGITGVVVDVFQTLLGNP